MPPVYLIYLFKIKKMSKNQYIVPHDFTHVGDVALKHAIHLGEHVQVEIKLLHLVSSKEEIPAAKLKMQKIIDGIECSNGTEIVSLIKVGSIFEDIGKIATQELAQLIIMGTHGEKGMQKLFGSYAMKVITSCDIPFLIVQDDTQLRKIEHIVIPIDLTKESLQIVKIAGDLATMFGSEVHVIGEKQNDEHLNQQMKNRILIVKNEYDDRGLTCNVEFLKDTGPYFKKIEKYSERKNIDLIAIAYHSESLIPQFDKFAQNLITNSLNLPCMVLNSKPASALYF